MQPEKQIFDGCMLHEMLGMMMQLILYDQELRMLDFQNLCLPHMMHEKISQLLQLYE